MLSWNRNLILLLKAVRKLNVLKIQLLNPLSGSPTKWSNTLKQFLGNMPTNWLSMFDHFVKLALEGLSSKYQFFFFSLTTKPKPNYFENIWHLCIIYNYAQHIYVLRKMLIWFLVSIFFFFFLFIFYLHVTFYILKFGSKSSLLHWNYVRGWFIMWQGLK